MEPAPAVVVGYDGSGRADAALRWASREAQMRRLPLRLVTVAPFVVDGSPDRAEDRHWLVGDAEQAVERGRQLASSLLLDGTFTAEVRHGPPAGVLADESQRAALLVVGQRRQDRPVSSAVGSVSVVLAAHARCPVVVVRGGAGPERAALPVVVGIPDRGGDPGALDFAAGAAELRGVPLLIGTAWELPSGRTSPAAAPGGTAQLARELADRAAASCRAAEEQVRRSHRDLDTRGLVTELSPSIALAQASRRAALVVVGAQHPSTPEPGSGASGLGGVASDVLGLSACPVTVVRGEEVRGGDSRSAHSPAGSWRVMPG